MGLSRTIRFKRLSYIEFWKNKKSYIPCQFSRRHYYYYFYILRSVFESPSLTDRFFTHPQSLQCLQYDSSRIIHNLNQLNKNLTLQRPILPEIKFFNLAEKYFWNNQTKDCMFFAWNYDNLFKEWTKNIYVIFSFNNFFPTEEN